MVTNPAGAEPAAPAPGSGGAADPSVTGTSGKATDAKSKAGADTGAGAQDSTGAAPYDASGLSGLLGVGQAVVPASDSAGLAAPGVAPTGLEAALAAHRHHNGSAVLLGLTILIMVGLAGGAGARWWVGRPGRYWPA